MQKDNTTMQYRRQLFDFIDRHQAENPTVGFKNDAYSIATAALIEAETEALSRAEHAALGLMSETKESQDQQFKVPGSNYLAYLLNRPLFKYSITEAVAASVIFWGIGAVIYYAFIYSY